MKRHALDRELQAILWSTNSKKSDLRRRFSFGGGHIQVKRKHFHSAINRRYCAGVSTRQNHAVGLAILGRHKFAPLRDIALLLATAVRMAVGRVQLANGNDISIGQEVIMARLAATALSLAAAL
ncbi:hypothetical protein BH10ACI4_BH10ACI4_18680 [soil metagenome]